MKTYGFWMDKNGEYFETREHGTEIIDNPKQFGINSKIIQSILKAKDYSPQDTKQTSGRFEILKKAYENGWIRIRGTDSEYTFEFMGNIKRVAELIVFGFGEDNFGLFTFVRLHDLKNKKKWQGSYNELKKAVEMGEFEGKHSTKNAAASMRDRLLPAGAIFGESVKRMKKLISEKFR